MKIQYFAAKESTSRLLMMAVMCHGDEQDNLTLVQNSLTVGDLMKLITNDRKSSPLVKI